MHLRQSNLEPLLYWLQYILISVAADEWDTQTLCAKSASTPNPMKIWIGIAWQIVIDGEINAFNVDSSAKDVGSNTDTLVEFLEFLVAFDTR